MKKLILITLLTFTVGLAPVSAYGFIDGGQEQEVFINEDEDLFSNDRCFDLALEIKKIEYEIKLLNIRKMNVLNPLNLNQQSKKLFLTIAGEIKKQNELLQQNEIQLKQAEEHKSKIEKQLRDLQDLILKEQQGIPTNEQKEIIAILNESISSLNIAINTNKQTITFIKEFIEILMKKLANLSPLDNDKLKEILEELADIDNQIANLEKKKEDQLKKLLEDPECKGFWEENKDRIKYRPPLA
jgi:hypothetical protein